MKSFEELLEECRIKHGHLCAGQVIGVRMALLGCRLIGLDDPTCTEHQKKMIVFVEIDRCATDAISTVTGCKLGKRTLKYKDYGIMAATFLNMENGKAYRIMATEESKTLAARYAPHESDPYRQQLEAYKVMPLEELFRVEEVCVEVSDYDRPGPSRTKRLCQGCGVTVRDGREVLLNGTTLCKACAHGGYYRRIAYVSGIDGALKEQRI